MIYEIDEQKFISFAKTHDIDTPLITKEFNEFRFSEALKFRNYGIDDGTTRSLKIAAKIVIIPNENNDKNTAIIPSGIICSYTNKGEIYNFIKSLVSELKKHDVASIKIEFPIKNNDLRQNEEEIKKQNADIYKFLSNSNIATTYKSGEILAHQSELIEVKNNTGVDNGKAVRNAIEFLEVTNSNNLEYITTLEADFTNIQIRELLKTKNTNIFVAKFSPKLFALSNQKLHLAEQEKHDDIILEIQKGNISDEIMDRKSEIDKNSLIYKENIKFATDLIDKHSDIIISSIVTYIYNGQLYIINHSVSKDENLRLFNGHELLLTHLIQNIKQFDIDTITKIDMKNINNQEFLMFKGLNNSFIREIQKVLSK